MSINGFKSQEGEPQVSILQSTLNLPALPQASDLIKEYLAECNATMTDLDSFKPSIRSKRRKQNSRRRLNGFMAFRIYYSRAAKDSSLQKKLSSLLAKAWKEETKRLTWTTYASLYNETGGSDSFILWLHKCLGNKQRRLSSSVTSKILSNAFINDIEDVFVG